jgi:hypothetical protein
VALLDRLTSSRFQNIRHVSRNGCFKLPRLGVQLFEFLIQLFELLLEIFIANRLPRRNADVATGVERPSLCLDLLERCCLAQPGYVGVFRLLPEELSDLGLGFIATEGEVEFLVTIQADDIGEKADLGFRPITVGAVDLPVDVASV